MEGSCALEINTRNDSKCSSSFYHVNDSCHGISSRSLSCDTIVQMMDKINENGIPIEVCDDDKRHSVKGSSRSEMGINIINLNLRATGVVPNDSLMYYYPLQSPLGDSTCIAPSTMPSSPSQIIASSLLDDTLLGPREQVDMGQQHQHPKVTEDHFSKIVEHISILFHLGLFAILGIFIRYALQVLFGPDVANVTNDHTALYIDLPSNMVGCFFMGWVGVVFKRKISSFSKPLAIGLSTGLMGSITTFTSWIDQMVNLMIEGYWVTSIVGLLIGMELAQISLTLGIDSAKLIACVYDKIRNKLSLVWTPSSFTYPRSLYGFIMCLFIVGTLWVGSLTILVFEFTSHHNKKIWIACIVGPCGAWVRWYFARLNSQGIGVKKHFKWLPVGTLLTNVIATILMATLWIMHKVVKGQNSKTMIEGIEFGFIGCMSTVSTFVVEVQSLYQSSSYWRAYVYILLSLFLAFIFGTLISSILIWTRGYSQE